MYIDLLEYPKYIQTSTLNKTKYNGSDRKQTKDMNKRGNTNGQ